MSSRFLVLALASLALAPASLAEVQVARPAAFSESPSPAARTCDLRFREHTPVVTACENSCYVEAWDGPVLMAANTCSFPIWASYVYSAADGRTWRTPCYRLAPGADAVAIPEPTIDSRAERRVVVAQEPGTTGYHAAAPSPDCPHDRQVQPSTSN